MHHLRGNAIPAGHVQNPSSDSYKIKRGKELRSPRSASSRKISPSWLKSTKIVKICIFVINFGVDSIPDVDLRYGRGSIFYNPTQPIPSVYRPNPTDNWCRHSWPDQIQPNSKHQHNALVVAKHNCKYPKMQKKYANHQFRHNHHHYHHHQQHNLIQWPKSILLQGTLDENSQRWTMTCQFDNYNSEKYINSGIWTQPNPTHWWTQPTTMSVMNNKAFQRTRFWTHGITFSDSKPRSVPYSKPCPVPHWWRRGLFVLTNRGNTLVKHTTAQTLRGRGGPKTRKPSTMTGRLELCMNTFRRLKQKLRSVF